MIIIKNQSTNRLADLGKLNFLREVDFDFQETKEENGRKIREMVMSEEAVSLSRVRKINYNVINRCLSKAIETQEEERALRSSRHTVCTG